MALALAACSAQAPAPSQVEIPRAPPLLAVAADEPPPPEPEPEVCPPSMALLPAGKFTLGERGDKAEVRPFCLDLTEVTAAAYQACVQRGLCSTDGLDCGSEATYGRPGASELPINCVIYAQALAYCRAVEKRLPTEEEWEWAGRGGPEAREYPWGSDEPRDQLCWSGASSLTGPCKVGSFPAGRSAHGILDMAGNMYEWTLVPPDGGHLLRGGSWPGTLSPGYRASSRAPNDPGSQTTFYGFRCAANAR